MGDAPCRRGNPVVADVMAGQHLRHSILLRDFRDPNPQTPPNTPLGKGNQFL